MKDIFDYENNIKVITTVNGDKVISLNKEIYTVLLNAIFDSSEYHEEHKRNGSAKDMIKLWNALRDKEHK